MQFSPILSLWQGQRDMCRYVLVSLITSQLSALRFTLLFLQVLWCLWIKAVPVDLPFELYSGSKAEEHLAHFLRKPTLSKCSYNAHPNWALRFRAWENFKVIKNTYHWKHLGLYHVFITNSWQPCINICYLLTVTWPTADTVEEKEKPTESCLRVKWRATERNHGESPSGSHLQLTCEYLTWSKKPLCFMKSLLKPASNCPVQSLSCCTISQPQATFANKWQSWFTVNIKTC